MKTTGHEARPAGPDHRAKSAPVARSDRATSPTLLQRVRDPGDSTAWREFDDLYGELVLRYSRRAGMQHWDAEDIRQNVMLRLSKALRAFVYDPRRGRFRDYLGRVARNEIARYVARPLRRAALEETHGPLDPGEIAEPDPDDEAWDEEWMQHHLRLGMRQVRLTADPRSIEVFEHLLVGRSIEDVSARFSMSLDAVHKVKQRMRDRLKAHVARQILDEDGRHEG